MSAHTAFVQRLAHEVGHCKMLHLEKRILRVFTSFFRPKLIVAYCQAQELAADQFAAGCGYGMDLVNAFARLKPNKGTWHPSLELRISRLLAWLSKA